MVIKQYTDSQYSWLQNVITLYENGKQVDQKKVAYLGDEYDALIRDIEQKGYRLAFDEDVVERARQGMKAAEDNYVYIYKRKLMKPEEK